MDSQIASLLPNDPLNCQLIYTLPHFALGIEVDTLRQPPDGVNKERCGRAHNINTYDKLDVDNRTAVRTVIMKKGIYSLDR